MCKYKALRQLTWLSIFLVVIGHCTVRAQQVSDVEVEQAVKLDQKAKQILSIDMQLASMANAKEGSPIASKLKAYLSIKPFAAHNTAEQCLIYFIQGNIFYHKGQLDQAIEQYLAAEKLLAKLSDQQVESPPFYQIDWQLALSYAKQQDYKNAVNYKKSFFKKYKHYYQAQQRTTVERLSKQYNMSLKRQQNELLAQQNKVKAVELENTQQKEQLNQRGMLLIVVALLVVTALMLRQLWIRQKLQRLARTDSLTQLPNRKALFEYAEAQNQQARAQGFSSCVLLFDIDHFKQVNDQYGHLAGDYVLQQTALLAQEVMRTRDFIARFGGEEFIAILPDVDFDQAKAIAERLREKIQLFNFYYQQQAIDITISVGVAYQAYTTLTFEHLIHHADEAMYQAKHQGRNQVVCQSIE